MSTTKPRKTATGARKKPGPPTGPKMGGKLQGDYDARGGTQAGLYNTYSLKNGDDIVFVGDLLFLNFLLCESDPTVLRINYKPFDPLITAEVLHRGGRLELRTVRRAEDVESAKVLDARKELVARYEHQPMTSLGEYHKVWSTVFTEQELIPGNETRLRNWHRVLPWYAQARFHSLAHMEQKFHAHMQHNRRTDVRRLLAIESVEGNSALLLAAAIRSVANGEYESDLNVETFGLNTRIYKRGHE